ncbi:hypothetical protein OIU76_021224 [Salix suchowensis]|nr:hypothetical protein OIU76_021224 [Salix suchowensis]
MLCSKLVTSTTEVTWGSKIQIILSKKIFSSQYDLNTLFMLTESSYYIIKALSLSTRRKLRCKTKLKLRYEDILRTLLCSTPARLSQV